MTDTQSDVAAFRPLYAQIRDLLIKRLISGSWAPGMMLPSEFQLADELGVSQGTVRKALDAMTAEQLLVRRQGRGTFVAVPEEGRILFKFFRLAADEGQRLFPQSTVIARGREAAATIHREKLGLPKGAEIWLIERVRKLGGRPVIFERIALPFTRFRGLGDLDEIPNNVYALYSESFGITIGKAEEKLKAATVTDAAARHLGCPTGHPVLNIERVAVGLDGSPVELRLSTCLTDDFHYRADL